MRRTFSQWTLEQVSLAHKRYQQITIKFSLSLPQFCDVLALKPGDPLAKVHFDKFATARTPDLVDAMEVITGIAFFANATLDEKIQFIFNLYDFDELGTITMDELNILMRTTCRTMAKIGSMNTPGGDDLQAYSLEVFKFCREDPDGELSLADFTRWAASKQHLLRPFLGELTGDSRPKLYFALEKDDCVFGCVEFEDELELQNCTLAQVREKLVRTVGGVPEHFAFTRQGHAVAPAAEESTVAWDCLPFCLLGSPGLCHSLKGKRNAAAAEAEAQTRSAEGTAAAAAAVAAAAAAAATVAAAVPGEREGVGGPSWAGRNAFRFSFQGKVRAQ
jgi:Ca2+-binding EF-hand superfamily protein